MSQLEPPRLPTFFRTCLDTTRCPVCKDRLFLAIGPRGPDAFCACPNHQYIPPRNHVQRADQEARKEADWLREESSPGGEGGEARRLKIYKPRDAG